MHHLAFKKTRFFSHHMEANYNWEWNLPLVYWPHQDVTKYITDKAIWDKKYVCVCLCVSVCSQKCLWKWKPTLFCTDVTWCDFMILLQRNRLQPWRLLLCHVLPEHVQSLSFAPNRGTTFIWFWQTRKGRIVRCVRFHYTNTSMIVKTKWICLRKVKNGWGKIKSSHQFKNRGDMPILVSSIASASFLGSTMLSNILEMDTIRSF